MQAVATIRQAFAEETVLQVGASRFSDRRLENHAAWMVARGYFRGGLLQIDECCKLKV